MTLEELKNRCKNLGFKYAYGSFKDVVEPPHLIAIINRDDNFKADNRIYKKYNTIQLDYTYLDKNIEEQDKIEDEILKDVVWEKTQETYLSDEKIWQVSYFFDI